MQNMNSAFLAVLWLLRWQHILQEAQLMMTNPRDAFRGQSMSPSIVPFHMLGILCNSNLVFKTCRFSDIRPQKMTLKSGSEVTQSH